jgi:hypothetical protein
MTTRTASAIIGIIFIAVGILGFIDNPIVYDSETAIFHANTLHNAIHIGSGVLCLIFAMAAPSSAGGFLKFFGFIYLFLGILGLINIGTSGMGELLGFLHVNGADNLLHVGLGVIILLAGFLPSARR